MNCNRRSPGGNRKVCNKRGRRRLPDALQDRWKRWAAASIPNGLRRRPACPELEYKKGPGEGLQVFQHEE